LGQLDDALECYRRAMAVDPYYSEYYNETGNILQRQERYDEALEMYALAERYSAPYPELFYNLAVCEAHRHDWAAAVVSLSRSLNLDPQQPEALLLRADALGALMRPDEAIRDIEAALVLAPYNASAHVNRAVLNFERANYDAALADMDAAIALEPTVADHFDNRAAVLEAIGRISQSADDRGAAAALRLST
jgi:tetratricopeptide (TPR) repeat protein